MSTVDVDRRMNAHAHVAGLKRLSARASKGPVSPIAARKGCFSFIPFARNVIDCLRKWKVQIANGLSDEEFARIEAAYGFTFPPDLRAILHEGLPVGVGFPDWRSAGSQQLRMRLNLPIAGLSYEVARGRFWAKQWGPSPYDTEQALRIARAALRKVPILIPVYNYCYISSSPSLAGNPIFFVYQKDVFYGGCDLAEFFEREKFVTNNSESPDNFAELHVAHGRVDSLGSGADWFLEDGRSFRIEKPPVSCRLMRNESSGEARMGIEAGKNGLLELELGRPVERTEWKGEESWKDLEAWGRNLDLLARGCDPYLKNAETPRRGVDGLARHHNSNCPDCPSRSVDNSPRLVDDAISTYRSFHSRSPSGKSSTTPLPSLADKITRRIEFWSEIAEKGQSVNCKMGEYLFVPSKVDMDLAKLSLDLQEWDDQPLADLRDRCLPQWLATYLEQIAATLRTGGWNEEDINGMVGSSLFPHEQGNRFFDKQNVLEGLVLQFNMLSDVLRRAGWSTQAVAEALDIEISLKEERRRPSNIPAQLAARIGKLAEYVVQV